MSRNEEFLLSHNENLWQQLQSLAEYTNELRQAVKDAGIPVPPPHVVRRTGVRTGNPLPYGSMEEERVTNYTHSLTDRLTGIRPGKPHRYGSMEEENGRATLYPHY